MSDENARKRAKKNQSDGAYLKGCMARSTCPMQPAWLKLAPTDDTIAIHSETAGQTQQPWFTSGCQMEVWMLRSYIGVGPVGFRTLKGSYMLNLLF